MVGTRNSIRYNSVGVFLSESPAYNPENQEIRFFNRCQSVDLNLSITRQNVQHIGSQNFLDRKIVTESDISFDINYLITDGYEENVIGLNVEQNPKVNKIGTVHNNIKEDKNLYMVIGEEQKDLTGYANQQDGYRGLDLLALGNCYVTNYSISASVGDLAKASVSMKASNINYKCLGLKEKTTSSFVKFFDEMSAITTEDGKSLIFENEDPVGLEEKFQTFEVAGADIASLDLENFGEKNTTNGIIFEPIMYNSTMSAIPPGGINVKIRNLDHGGPIISEDEENSCIKGTANIQSFNIDVPFEREDLYGFQSMHVYGRKLKFPQLGTISFSLLLGAFKRGEFKDIFKDDREYEIEISFNNQCFFTCKPLIPKDAKIKLLINNAKLDGYSMNQGIGSPGTVDCNFSFGISTNKGLYMSGNYFKERTSECHT